MVKAGDAGEGDCPAQDVRSPIGIANNLWQRAVDAQYPCNPCE
jgi:hypothetical protein